MCASVISIPNAKSKRGALQPGYFCAKLLPPQSLPPPSRVDKVLKFCWQPNQKNPAIYASAVCCEICTFMELLLYILGLSDPTGHIAS